MTTKALNDGNSSDIAKNYVSEPVTIPQTAVSPTKPDTARIRLAQYERRAGRRATIDSADYPWSPTGTIFEEDSYDTKSFMEYGSRSSTASSTLIGTSDGSQLHTNIAQPAGITCPPQGFEDVFSTLYETTPTFSRRYDREIAIRNHNQSWIIEPASMPYLQRDEIPGWIRKTNPDGQPYYFRPINSDRYARRYVTEANLADAGVYSDVSNILNLLEIEIEKQKTLPGLFDMVLEQSEDGWVYYMVDHNRRSIFWLRPFDATWIADQVFGLSSIEQMEHWFHYEYWTFMEQFPHVEEISDGAIDELTGILIHGSIDTMTSLDSTMIYSLDECRDMLGMIRLIRNLRASEKKTQICDPFIAVSISRMMAMFEQSRFMNLYGHHGARLGREQSIRGPVENYRTFLISFLSPLLFRAPDTHLRGLKNIWVDKVINQRPWKIFVDTLKEEWIEFILYATVLLNANVAYLAIPSVDNSTQITLSQVASLLSIIASMGSILIGLLLVRQHRTRSKETAAEAAAYLLKRTHHTLGLETLAIMYSLPYALLMWGIITFLAAIAILCFEGTALWQQILFTLAWAAIAILVFWTVLTGWETTEPSTVKAFFNWLRHCVSLLKARKRDPEADLEVVERKPRSFGLRKVLQRRKFKRWHQSNASLTSVENSYNGDQ